MSVVEEIREVLGESQNKFLQTLHSFQKEGAYCDIQLCVGRERWMVPAHRLVLAAKSPYFQAMFSSEFLEKNSTVIDIDPASEVFTKRESLEAVIEYFYTGNLPRLSQETVREIFRASSLWILDNLQKICEYFLAVNLTMENCVDILNEARKYNSHILTQSCLRFIYSNEDLAENSLYLQEELSKLKSSTKTHSKYFVAFHSIPKHTCVKEFLADLKFSCDDERYKKIGIQFEVDLSGKIVMSDFNIRLPTWIDFKQFESRRSREIRDAVIVCGAAKGESCYFGIANRTRGSQVLRFCGILEYHLRTEGWDIIPYLQNSIQAEYKLNTFHHASANLLFFIENSSEGPKLKIMNFQQNCLFIRSLEEEAIIVDQIHLKGSLWTGDLEALLETLKESSSSQGMFMMNDEFFFQIQNVVLRINSRESRAVVLDSGPDGSVMICLPLYGRNAFLVVVRVLRTNRALLKVRKYDLDRGYVALSEPEERGYSLSHPLHAFHDEDKVYLVWRLKESENYCVNTYDLVTDTWTFDVLEDSQMSSENQQYSIPFSIYT